MTECANKCSMCGKTGLPIFLTRYAIAQRDKAGDWKKWFEDNIPGRSMGDAGAPEIKGDFCVENPPYLGLHAMFTQRTLRQGYVYMYDEARNTWQGYLVGPEGDLYPFDVPGSGPTTLSQQDFKPCAPAKNGAICRCITIPDAQDATFIWLAFSDTQWTQNVWQKHQSDANYRVRHMRKFDIKTWLKSGKHSHAGNINTLSEHVAEFCKTVNPEAFSASITPLNKPVSIHNFSKQAAALGIETPDPILETSVEELQRNANKGDKTCFQLLLMSSKLGIPLQELLKASAISGANFIIETCERMAGAGRATKGKAAIFALDDLPGVAQDLALLMAQRENIYNSQNKWSHPIGVSGLILNLRDTIYNQAEQRAIDNARQRQHAYRVDVAGYQEGHGNQVRESGFRPLTPDQQKEYDRLGVVTSDDLEQQRIKDWAKYLERYKEFDRVDIQDQYDREFVVFDAIYILPLAEAHATVMESDAMHNVFVCNYDSKDILSGERYSTLFFDCIRATQDKLPCSVLYTKWSDGDATDLKNLGLRAAVYNNDELVETLIQGAADLNKYGTQVIGLNPPNASAPPPKETDLNSELAKKTQLLAKKEICDKLFSKFTKQFSDALGKGFDTTPAGRVMLNITGALVRTLSKDLAKGQHSFLSTLMGVAHKTPIQIVEYTGASKAGLAQYLVKKMQAADGLSGVPKKLMEAKALDRIQALQIEGMNFGGKVTKRFFVAINYDVYKKLAEGRAVFMDKAAQNALATGFSHTIMKIPDIETLHVLEAGQLEEAGRRVNAAYYEQKMMGRLAEMRQIIGEFKAVRDSIHTVTASGLTLLVGWVSLSVARSAFDKAHDRGQSKKLMEAFLRFDSGIALLVGAGLFGMESVVKFPLVANKLGPAVTKNVADTLNKYGRRAGAVGAGIMAVLDVAGGVEAFQKGRYGLTFAYAAAAAVGVWASAGMIIKFSARYNFYLFIAVLVTSSLVALLKPNPYEDWLEECYFGKQRNKRYTSAEMEAIAFRNAKADVEGK